MVMILARVQSKDPFVQSESAIHSLGAPETFERRLGGSPGRKDMPSKGGEWLALMRVATALCNDSMTMLAPAVIKTATASALSLSLYR